MALKGHNDKSAKCMFVACLSSPNESREQQHVLVRKSLIKSKMCHEVGLVNVPQDLRFTSFDGLLVCADELEKHDPVVETVLKRVESLARGIDSSPLNIHFQGRQVAVETYISRFHWDDGRFPRYNTVADNLQTLVDLVKKMDDDVMAKASAYADLNNRRLSMKNDAESTYLYRDLTYIVTPEVVDDPQDFIDTEHLTTILVFVPSGMDEEWLSSYMHLCDNVVPNCAKRLNVKCSGHSLWRVIIFKNVLESFIECCKSRNWVAKPFIYSEERYRAIIDESSRLETESHRQEAFLSRIYRVAFSDVFTCWIHLKAMRAFCEAALKFGLPINFNCFSLWPTDRCDMNSLKHTLDSMLRRSPAGNGTQDHNDLDGEVEYDSFISLSFNLLLITICLKMLLSSGRIIWRSCVPVSFGQRRHVVKLAKNTEEYHAALKGSEFVLAKFGASWCKPCQKARVYVDELSEEYPNMLFLDVDVDELPQIADEEGVNSIPMYKIFNCVGCGIPVTSSYDLISTNFRGRTGSAWLFSRAYNVSEGMVEERMMTTGHHAISDVYCNGCGNNLGWKYHDATQESQKYKCGKVILEKVMSLVHRINLASEFAKGQ
ncbi:V-type proton ATPase subunit C 1-B [Babesia sp. Xinjiang]|uniref:V-type proton ATPase subunit C 1-B n=1 Tax=Babesia sp. Xinjiang TaxID=462227 RepID=UPI000A24C7F0|nr:V-type proton ATPase subunit C 1-B [Babesia sp. Xinjiang]XP_028872088.1 V-type proton ATPase subunit C 1-B [Babesia sp. Xinjiang]ORM41545.1 V-type proton ATPase subunit C 1-B [Babesia sp. Xinjiang]ORM41632.1 V-type proton ATPase subunit C 1-B [Babesia sp. Xinjiang]